MYNARMKQKLAVLFGLTLLPALAADPAGFVLWPKGTPPGGAKQGAKFANHGLSVSHREGNGIPELHEKQTDIFVVESGEATLLVGGEVVGRKTVSPGEIRGASISGGVKKNLSAGDVVHIPAGIPHQFFLEPGKQITYFVVKVDNP
jgi:mannose-6-phosphate isomerase-like protein (cupin superfamily)